eukprot:TRINITY_DN52499_c0_g1_i1.p1 TRINITY_DN52499_c0_g1~~TRINITY_DN52499_c0_g1_i1.p1  ORF type:complete len:565 (+),score=44.22 TRINITY_DN52499_c0_g1_i1:33-1727(+)
MSFTEELIDLGFAELRLDKLKEDTPTTVKATLKGGKGTPGACVEMTLCPLSWGRLPPRHPYNTGRLLVQVVSLVGLQPKDHTLQLNPFVKAYMGATSYATEPQLSPTPTWKENFVMWVPDCSTNNLTLELWDVDEWGEDKLGTTQVPVKDLTDNQPVSLVLPMDTGYIAVKLKAEGFGQPGAPRLPPPSDDDEHYPAKEEPPRPPSSNAVSPTPSSTSSVSNPTPPPPLSPAHAHPANQQPPPQESEIVLIHVVMGEHQVPTSHKWASERNTPATQLVQLPDTQVQIVSGSCWGRHSVVNTACKYATLKPFWDESCVIECQRSKPITFNYVEQTEDQETPVIVGRAELSLDDMAQGEHCLRFHILQKDGSYKAPQPLPGSIHTAATEKIEDISVQFITVIMDQSKVALKTTQARIASMRQSAGGRSRVRKHQVAHESHIKERRQAAQKRRAEDAERTKFLSTVTLSPLKGARATGVAVDPNSLKALFAKLDVDGNGRISKTEFREIYQELHMNTDSEMPDYHTGTNRRGIQAEMDEILKKYNMMGDNYLSFDEFAVLMLKIIQE